MPTPRFWYLQNLGLTGRLPDDVARAIRDQARLERWGHRAKIWHSQDPSDVSLVLGGAVELLEGPRSTGRVQLKGGDVFGHLGGSLDDMDTPLRAYDETTIGVLPREAFRDLVGDYLGQAETKLGRFGRRTQVAMPLQPLLYTPPRQRLARVLLHLVESEGDIEGKVGGIPIKLKARRLADLTKVPTPRVQRLLELLEQEKLINHDRSVLEVLDLEELRRLARGE